MKKSFVVGIAVMVVGTSFAWSFFSKCVLDRKGIRAYCPRCKSSTMICMCEGKGNCSPFCNECGCTRPLYLTAKQGDAQERIWWAKRELKDAEQGRASAQTRNNPDELKKVNAEIARWKRELELAQKQFENALK